MTVPGRNPELPLGDLRALFRPLAAPQALPPGLTRTPQCAPAPAAWGTLHALLSQELGVISRS